MSLSSTGKVRLTGVHGTRNISFSGLARVVCVEKSSETCAVTEACSFLQRHRWLWD